MISASGEADVQEPPSTPYLLAENPGSSEEQIPGFQPISENSFQFLQTYFPGTTLREWNSWQWQLRHSFSSIQELGTFLRLSTEELLVSSETGINLPIRITPYFASLIHQDDARHALRRTMVPVIDELILSQGEQSDPLNEHQHNKLNCLVHRYPDRVLFLVTNFCSSYCRYCTRSHIVAGKGKSRGHRADWDEALEYIREHSEIRDVLLSGGDPLTLPDDKLKYLLTELRAIPHVEIIRIGTKVPVVLPQRITPTLVRLLRKFHPLYLSIHFTHPEEITPEVSAACNRLADAGMPMGSQTVLLKGINDDPEVFKKLMHELLKIRVRPYYLYQCDPVPGSAHFRTPVEKGLEIIRSLRGFTSGYAVPHFVIDAPGGGGKIPILPNYVEGRKNGDLLLTNYQGKHFSYPDYV